MARSRPWRSRGRRPSRACWPCRKSTARRVSWRTPSLPRRRRSSSPAMQTTTRGRSRRCVPWRRPSAGAAAPWSRWRPPSGCGPFATRSERGRARRRLSSRSRTLTWPSTRRDSRCVRRSRRRSSAPSRASGRRSASLRCSLSPRAPFSCSAITRPPWSSTGDWRRTSRPRSPRRSWPAMSPSISSMRRKPSLNAAGFSSCGRGR
mmetsp:Transcript_19496/g.39327  ORF Transcript_19496/g.39327 Transcript_19496/m.39327 type:complete len:205 (-) Transcript_19496:763-1377(-)